MTHIETDVLVVGAGPVGLFTVFECGMLKMRCHVVDALEMVGGQCAALYPEKPIYDIPAIPAIMGQDLIENLKKQIAPFHPTFHLGQQVEGLKRDGEGFFHVTTSTGTVFHAKAIIIAAGGFWAEAPSSGRFGALRRP